MKRPAGSLRIIGGEHRSRLLHFDPESGVRPTPDRVRQTLFDWLAPVIEGAQCLDLFAGSGALGFEALSRGAAQVTFVDSSERQIAGIRKAADMLRLGARAEVLHADAMSFFPVSRLPSPVSRLFDIVFLDPPYGGDLLDQTLTRLPQVLKPGHRIYLEWPGAARPPLPENLRLLREKSAGQVSYGLATFGD